jgi:hypothetical protein
MPRNQKSKVLNRNSATLYTDTDKTGNSYNGPGAYRDHSNDSRGRSYTFATGGDGGGGDGDSDGSGRDKNKNNRSESKPMRPGRLRVCLPAVG